MDISAAKRPDESKGLARYVRYLARGFRSVCVVSCFGLLFATGSTGCNIGPRSAVSMKIVRSKPTPRDASVYIDEEFIGPLYYVAAHGVRLPTGRHRVSITKEGYFPWDRLVEADREPIALDVELVPVPD